MPIHEKKFSVTANLHGLSIELRHVVASSHGDAAREGIDQMIKAFREAFELPDSHVVSLTDIKVHVRREED